MRLTHRAAGFTLVETMIALVLTGLAMALVYRVMVGQQRQSAAQTEQAALETTLRTAIGFIAAELSETAVGTGEVDLVSVAPESLTYRAMRGGGVACGATVGSVDLLLSAFASFRQPQPARDSLMLWVGSDSAQERWLRGPVTATTAVQCGGAPALRISTTLDSTAIAMLGPVVRLPVRTFELMQLKLYRSLGSYWLGARSVGAGETTQPVAGPLEASGLRFAFFDSAGGTTTRPADIRTGHVTVRAAATHAIANGAGTILLRDSLTALLRFRNRGP